MSERISEFDPDFLRRRARCAGGLRIFSVYVKSFLPQTRNFYGLTVFDQCFHNFIFSTKPMCDKNPESIKDFSIISFINYKKSGSYNLYDPYQFQ